MMRATDYDALMRACGGVPVVKSGGDPENPGDIGWNFGVLNPGTVLTEATSMPTLYQRFPNLQGRWDGKTNINWHEAVRKVLGSDIPPHYQPTGTCGGRAGSRGPELLQTIMIAAGKRAKFKYVSHAWVYFLARREFGMLGGGDGVADGAVPPVLAKYGMLNRDECPDKDMNGRDSDRYASLWGGGRMSKDDERTFTELAKDNLVTAVVQVKSAAEMADAIASGGIIICSDSRGYSMERDNEGFCRAQGTWMHYHVRSGVRVSPSGRKGFDYNQSWNFNVPSGPLLPGCPDNCFGVDWDVDDANTKRGTFHAIFGMDLWDLESGKFDIPWIF
jgi:hypothetical protein